MAINKTNNKPIIWKYSLNEEVTTADVRRIVNSKLDELLKQREFEKKVNEISAKVLEKFITQLFNKRLMWTNSLK